MTDELRLLRDRDVAKRLAHAPVTIRVQRLKRRRSETHWLTLDCITMGSSPRYRSDEFEAWLLAQCSQQMG